jgi:protein-disulfide isomerase
MTSHYLPVLLLAVLAPPAWAQSATPPADPPATPAEQTETPPADEDPALAPRLDERPFGVPFGKAWLGAPDGNVTLLVFADYACPACREAQPVIDALVADDPHLKVVYLILINEDEGRQAAMTSLAVAQSGGAWVAFHRALDAGGDPGPAGIAAALKAAGIDPASLPPLTGDALIDSPILDELNRNDRALVEHKGTAVPAWLIGTGPGKARNGFDPAVLRAAIARARAK